MIVNGRIRAKPIKKGQVKRRVIKDRNAEAFKKHFANAQPQLRMNRLALRRLRNRRVGTRDSIEPQPTHPIGKLKDAHKGQMAILGGNGPCQELYDFNKTKDYVSIAVNRNVFPYDPDYWVWVDPRWHKDPECVESNAVKFKATWHGNTIPKGVIPFHQNSKIDDMRPHYYGSLYLASGVLQPAMHIAWIMGCNPIVIIGAPQATLEKRRYFYDENDFDPDSEKSRTDREKIFEYRGHMTTKYYKRQLRHHSAAANRIYDASKCKTLVINATGCGIWDNAPIVSDFDEVMQEFYVRTKREREVEI